MLSSKFHWSLPSGSLRRRKLVISNWFMRQICQIVCPVRAYIKLLGWNKLPTSLRHFVPSLGLSRLHSSILLIDSLDWVSAVCTMYTKETPPLRLAMIPNNSHNRLSFCLRGRIASVHRQVCARRFHYRRQPEDIICLVTFSFLVRTRTNDEQRYRVHDTAGSRSLRPIRRSLWPFGSDIMNIMSSNLYTVKRCGLHSDGVEKDVAVRNAMGDSVERHFLDITHATKVQAFYRGYLVRKHRTIRPLDVDRTWGGVSSPTVYRRIPSDFTMSEFDDESLMGDESCASSIGTPAWSPRTKFRRNTADSCFHNSIMTVSTAAVTDPSEGEHQQGSFSTIFSPDAAQDRPIRMPFRKGTPPRYNLNQSRSIGIHTKISLGGTKNGVDEEGKPTEHIVPCFPDLARLDLSGDDVNNDMGCCFTALPFLKQRKSKQGTDQGHLPFMSFFARGDAPAKPPERAASPCTHPAIPNLPSGLLDKVAQDDDSTWKKSLSRAAPYHTIVHAFCCTQWHYFVLVLSFGDYCNHYSYSVTSSLANWGGSGESAYIYSWILLISIS